MSSTEVKKNSKAKANLVAFWEWFKSAAWLQVILIVGIVVGIVVSIPYIIRSVNSISDSSDFYEGQNINYDRLQTYISGEDDACDGIVGNGTGSGVDEGKTGFAVIFYKDNCTNCEMIESYVEDWYNLTNDTDAFRDGVRLYTINVGWVPGDVNESTDAEGGDLSDYQNDNITISEQESVMRSIRNVYRSQADYYKSSEVTYETLSSNITAGGVSTIPTPTMVFYSKDATAEEFEPTKVFCGTIGNLTWDRSGVNTMLNDLYGISLYNNN